MDDANFWALFQRAAKLAGCDARARVNLDRPDEGIAAVSIRPEVGSFRLLSISPSDDGRGWPAKLIDTYTRGDDMVATYDGTDDWPFAPQIYWTAESLDRGGSPVSALSLMVSIQTDRLDTHPQINVRSTVPTDEIVRVAVAGDELLVDSHADGDLQVDSRATACGLVWRLPGDDLSYAEIMPKSDFRRLSVRRAAARGGAGATIESRWELFSEFLEKGVIRRARLQAAFLPRDNDVQLAAELCQAINCRPLPLTT